MNVCSISIECINTHAPIKCGKVTKYFVSWMLNLDIQSHKSSCDIARFKSFQTNSDHGWLTNICQNEKPIKTNKINKTLNSNLSLRSMENCQQIVKIAKYPNLAKNLAIIQYFTFQDFLIWHQVYQKIFQFNK